jgi:spermidine/putrescine transport system substrate-binding protein
MHDKSGPHTTRTAGGLHRRDLLKTAVLAGASFAAATGVDLAGMARALAETKLSGPLLISNWPYYIDKNTVPNFAKKFGIKVNYVEDINDNDSLFGKIAGPLQTGQNPGRDIIVPTGYLVDRLVKLGWLEKFSHDEIPNIKNLEPSLAHPTWDPNSEYCLPWATFLTGVAYNIKKTGHELTSINDIFDPTFKGHVSMLNEMRDTLALTMLGMGIDPAKATYSDAEATAKKIKANVDNGQIRQFFGNDYGAALSRGDIWVAFAWSGDVIQLQKDNPDLRFLIPKEGLYHSVDNMAMPLHPAHRAAALAWMNYIYEPAVYAQIAATVQYIPPVVGVKQELAKIDPKLAANPLIFPSAEVMAKTNDFTQLTAEDEQKWNALFQSVIGH